jgi:hypothetical protein
MTTQTTTLHAASQAAAATRDAIQQAHALATGLAAAHLHEILQQAAALTHRIQTAAEASRAEPPDHTPTAQERIALLHENANEHRADAARLRDQARTGINTPSRKRTLDADAAHAEYLAAHAQNDADAIEEALATLAAHADPATYQKDTGEQARDTAAAERARHTLARHGLTA